MITANLHWAFEEQLLVLTDEGPGIIRRRRVADLILPTGELLFGFPEESGINTKGEAAAELAPGRYPVLFSVLDSEERGRSMAFVTIEVSDEKAVTWSCLGSFFTDDCDGCLVDASLAQELRSRVSGLEPEAWKELKKAALTEGEGELSLESGAGNAIVFQTPDGYFPYLQGLDAEGKTAQLVVVVYTGN